MGEAQRKTISFGFGGAVLSAVIIASRAFGSRIPMEEWSVFSWFLMTLPLTAPFIAFGTFLLLCAAVYAVACAFGRRQ